MRVATYSQPTAMSRASFAGNALLGLTILLGTAVLPQALGFFAPGALALVTPLWLAVYAMAFLGLVIGHGVNWLSWLVRYRILLVILMLGTAASIGWALAPTLSFERTVHLLGSTLVAIYIGFTVPLLTTLRVLGVVLGALFLASLAAVLALPALGIEDYAGVPVWRGVFVTKNGLGFWAAIGVLLYVALSDSTNALVARLLCYVMAALCLGLLVFSQSATSLLVMVLAGALSLYLFIAMRFRLGFVRMAVLAVLVGGLAAFVVINVPSAELIGRSDDLTGRGEVWAQTWKLILQRPATGFGYGVLWFPSPENAWIQDSLTDFTWTVHHAHNGFLQVASEIGLPLAVVALLMVVQQLVEIVYCQYQRQQVGVLFVLAFSVAYLISNFSEARFLVNRELFWILFIALPISMLRQINVSAGASVSAAEPAPGERAGPSAARAALSRGVVNVSPGGAAAATGPQETGAPGVLESTGEPMFDGHDEDDAFDQDDMDATLGSLTLEDADIDLGRGMAGAATAFHGAVPDGGAGTADHAMGGDPDDADDWVDPDATLERERDFSALIAAMDTAALDDADAHEPPRDGPDHHDANGVDDEPDDDDPLDQLQELDEPEPGTPRA